MKNIWLLLIILSFSMTSCRLAGTSVNSGLEENGKILDSIEDVLIIGYIVKIRQYEYGKKDYHGKYFEECSTTKAIHVSQKQIQPFADILKKHFRRIHISPTLLPELKATHVDLDKECHPLMISDQKSTIQLRIAPSSLINFFRKNEWNKEYFHNFSKHIIEQEKSLGKRYDAYFYLTFEIDQKSFVSEMNFIDLVGQKGNRLYYNEITHNLDSSYMPPESPNHKNKIKPTKQEFNEWLAKMLVMQAEQLEKDLATYQSSNKAVQGLKTTDTLLGL